MINLEPNKSTNVRSSPLLRALRRAAHASPALGAWIAEALFTIPRRSAPSEREARRLQTAERFTVRVRGTDLAAWQWGIGPTTTLLLHGWQGRAAQLGSMVQPLVDSGHRVVAVDVRAHGSSPGWRSTIADFSDVIFATQRRLGRLDAVIAHSLGAAALALALNKGLHLSAAALIAPPSSPRPTLAAVRAALGLDDAAHARFVARVEARVGAPVASVDVPRLVGGLRVPAIIVHDRSDRHVPWESGRRIADAWPAARLVSSEGLGHGRILEDPKIVSTVTGFILERLPAPERRDLDRWLDAIEGRTADVPTARQAAVALPVMARSAALPG